MSTLGWVCIVAACIMGGIAAFVMSLPHVAGIWSTFLFALAGSLVGIAFSPFGRKPKSKP